MINIHLDMTYKTSSDLFVMLKAEKTHSFSALPGAAGSWAAGLGQRDRAEGAEGGRERGSIFFYTPPAGRGCVLIHPGHATEFEKYTPNCQMHFTMTNFLKGTDFIPEAFSTILKGRSC